MAAFFTGLMSICGPYPWSQGFLSPSGTANREATAQGPGSKVQGAASPVVGIFRQVGLKAFSSVCLRFHTRSQGSCPDFLEGFEGWASVETSSANFKALKSWEAAS